MKPPPTRILKRIIRVVRHFTPEVWPWEKELWRQRIHHHSSAFHLGQCLLSMPFPADLPKAQRLRLLEAVGEYLTPLSSNPECHKKHVVWRNLRYSPPGPIGAYLWECCAQDVLCVRKANPPLFEGWKSLGNELHRDGCPHTDPVRSAEWDSGYLLAHGYHYERRKLMEWLVHHETRILNGAPPFPPYQPIPAGDI